MLKYKPNKIKKYSDARTILKQHDHKILGLHSQIVGSSVELKDGQWQLNILAKKENPSLRFFERINIDGLQVKVKVTGIFFANIDRKDKHRPAPSGVSIGHFNVSAGTLGCAVYKAGAGEVAHAYILSNNHVIAKQNDCAVGDVILQPGKYDGGDPLTDGIATLSEWQEIDFSGGINSIDAAIALADNYDDLSIDIEGIPNWVGDIMPCEVGQSVTKSGRTTGVTFDTITEISGEIVICYETYKGVYCTKWATFDEQIVTGDIGAGGDSGSLLIETTTGKAVGLYFAGTSTFGLANKIELVMERFGIQFFPQRVQAKITSNYDIQYTEKELKANYNIDHWGKELKTRYYIKGETTPTDPYFIYNLYELQHLNDLINTEYHYELGANIDASETVEWNVEDSEIYGEPPYARGFKPIEGGDYERISLDGKCYEIIDLYINRPTESQIGLFGGLKTNGGQYFKNIILKDVDITGLAAVGGLFGSIEKRYARDDNQVDNCSVFGYVNSVGASAANAGGLCGNASGTVLRRCSSSGIITSAGRQVGGLLGSGGDVYDSFSNMDVYSSSEAAGLVAAPYGIIQHCYSTGMVTVDEGEAAAGFLYGGGATVNHCYWDTETSGQSESFGGGEPKTTFEMRQQVTFIEWNFINTWYIIENVTNPFIRQYCWIIDLDEDATATSDFELVNLTGRQDEIAEATFDQEFVSLTDEIIETSESIDEWKVQYNITVPLDHETEATFDQEVTIEAGRLLPHVCEATSDFEAINWTQFLLENKYFTTQYLCKITGHQNGLADIYIPIKSFQSRLRTDGLNYISIVAPVDDDSVTGINQRPDGEIVIYMQRVFDNEVIYNSIIGG